MRILGNNDILDQMDVWGLDYFRSIRKKRFWAF